MSAMMLSVAFFNFMLSVIMLSVVMQSVVMLSVVMLLTNTAHNNRYRELHEYQFYNILLT